MTKPTEKDIREAMGWVGLALEPFDDVCSYDHHGYCQSHFGHEKPCPYEPEEQEKHQHTIRTALEEYKPKTVSREEVWKWAGEAEGLSQLLVHTIAVNALSEFAGIEVKLKSLGFILIIMAI